MHVYCAAVVWMLISLSVQMSKISSLVIAVHTKLRLYCLSLLIPLMFRPGPSMSYNREHMRFCVTAHPLLTNSWCCIVVQRCRRALSWNLFFFYQYYFWFSRSLQSLYWHKLIRFNQLQTHSADRTLHLRYYDGSPSQPMFPGKHRILYKSPRAIILIFMIEIWTWTSIKGKVCHFEKYAFIFRPTVIWQECYHSYISVNHLGCSISSRDWLSAWPSLIFLKCFYLKPWMFKMVSAKF